MVHVERINVQGKLYFRLVYNYRKNQKVTHFSKYIGKELPDKKRLQELKEDFLRELKRREIKDTALKRMKRIIVNKIRKEGIVKAGIFGSYARGEQTPHSDVDILLRYRKNSRKSFLDMVRLQRELSEELGKKVDLVTYGSISPYLKERILKEEVKIL